MGKGISRTRLAPPTLATLPLGFFTRSSTLTTRVLVKLLAPSSKFSDRQERWIMAKQEFNFKVEYMPGVSLVVPDAFSRLNVLHDIQRRGQSSRLFAVASDSAFPRAFCWSSLVSEVKGYCPSPELKLLHLTLGADGLWRTPRSPLHSHVSMSTLAARPQANWRILVWSGLTFSPNTRFSFADYTRTYAASCVPVMPVSE